MSARDELPFPRPWPEPSADPDVVPDTGAPWPMELDDDVPLEDGAPLETGAPIEAAPADDWAIDLDEDQWDALIPDDDYEPMPEYGDFWDARDAA